MAAQLSKFVRDDIGASAVEYGLIAALISIAAIGSLPGASTFLQTAWGNIAAAIGAAAAVGG